MRAVSFVFPHQLYAAHPALHREQTVYLIEDNLFFKQYKFHQQKLVLHRASLKYYQHSLQQKGYEAIYLDCNNPLAETEQLFKHLAEQNCSQVHLAEVTDYLLERRLKRYAARYNITLQFSQTPNFIRTRASNQQYFSHSKYYLTDYYISLRKELNILVDKGKPLGGKWSFDSDNRKKMSATVQVPPLILPPENEFVKEAKAYVATNFKENYGTLQGFVYPVTHDDAARWLDNFLAQRFCNYGIYQDAIVKGQNWLFHSILTPMLNTGLLDPVQIIERATDYALEHRIPVNSLEGFVRQVLGWREYIRAVYELRGVEERTANYWQHTRPLPQAMYTGTTGIPPVDDAIHRLLQTGYNHHIERLMVLGNFMLLCGFAPNAVYTWFMEMYIDSYDWVMVPNVYGMSQYADGGQMSTKPYISGSSYVLKMSNYGKGTWCAVWDALYWRFINIHQAKFAKNPRMSMMAALVSKMDATKLKLHLDTAENFLDKMG